MSEIKKVICGTLSKTMPNGKIIPPDYFELNISGETAELIRYENDKTDSFKINDSIVLEVALQEIEKLLDENPDEQPFNEVLPLANEVIFGDGTVKYAPKYDLSRILSNMIPMNLAASVMPQGLVSAPSPTNSVLNNFNNIGLTMGIPNGMNNMPLLQGLVSAAPPQTAPEKPVVCEQWKCVNCGAMNGGKFCNECGTPKPREE